MIYTIQALSQTREVNLTESESTIITAQYWTLQDNLPNQEIWGAFEDSRDIVWLQSGRNLCYYDGNKIVAVEHKPERLYTYQRTSFAEDKHSNIWRYLAPRKSRANPAPGSLEIYDPAQECFYSLQQYLDGNPTPQLSDDLYVFSMQQLVYIYDRQQQSLWCYDGAFRHISFAQSNGTIPDSTALTYLPGPDNHYWQIGKGSVQLLTAEGSVVTEYATADFNIFPGQAAFFLSENGQLWIHSLKLDQFPQALDIPPPVELRMHSTDQPIIPIVRITPDRTKPQVAGLQRDEKGFSTLSMDILGRVRDSKPGEETTMSPLLQRIDQRIPDLKISSERVLHRFTQFLRDGSLLISVNQGFLHIKKSPNYFKQYLPQEKIRGIATLDTNTLAAVTHKIYGGELREIQLKTGNSKTVKRPTPYTPYSLFTDENSIWVGLVTGDLERYNRQWQKQDTYASPTSRNYQEVKSLQYRTDSTLWYATNTGVVAMDLSKDSSYYVLEQPANHIHRDQSGDYWIGTNRGLYHLKTKRYYLDSIQNEAIPISHLYEDPQGVFWIASQLGLFRWVPFSSTYERFTTEDGLSNNIIHAVYPDRHGRLWLSSNHGIMSFEKATKDVNVYLSKDGLAGNEQNFMAHYQARDGRLYFGGQQGITAFYPVEIPKIASTKKSTIYWKSAELIDNSGTLFDRLSLHHTKGQTIKLPKKTEQVKLDFFLPSYFENSLKIEWKWNNTENWQGVEGDNSIFLLGLPYGKFQVSTRVTHNDGPRIPVYSQITFHRPYPFYFSPQFWLGVLLLNIILFWGGWEYRNRKSRRLHALLKQQVKEKTYQLAQEKRKLEKIDAAKTRLFRNITHELRTPLSVISTIAQQEFEKGGNNSAIGMELIAKETQRVDKMISEILKLSKLEMGMIKAEPKVVEWNSLIRTIFTPLTIIAEEKQLTYELVVNPPTDSYIYIDPEKIEYILNSLISNALKFVPKNGQILVTSTIKESTVELIVSDNGPGIPQEEQEMIFKRYYHGKGPTDSQYEYEGFGIGLALCKEYTELLGGHISLDSEVDKGATFYVELPLVWVKSSDIEAHFSSTNATTTSPITSSKSFSDVEAINLARPQVLIVEDNIQFLTQIERLINKDYEIDTALNGQEAFNKLEANPQKYDVVISDIMIPLVNGYNLLEKVRAHPKIGFTPFLFLTALNTQEDKLKALRLGVDAFVPKPFQKQELLAQIDNLVRRQQIRKQSRKWKEPIDEEEPVNGIPQLEQNDIKEYESYDEAWMRRLEDVVRHNLSRLDFKVTDMAYQLHVSERTLRNYIKEYTGLTPSSYLQKTRLDQAMIFIKTKRYKTVSEIAYAVGFKDSRYFSKVFKKEFGQSPSSYLT